jgi:hypothetical protein
VFDFVGFNQYEQNFKPVAFWCARQRFVIEKSRDFAERGFIVFFGMNGGNAHFLILPLHRFGIYGCSHNFPFVVSLSNHAGVIGSVRADKFSNK